MGDGNIAGASRGYDNRLAFDYPSFLLWIHNRGFRVCSTELLGYLHLAFGFQRLVPYFDYLDGEGILAQDRTLEVVKELVDLDGRLHALLIRWIGSVEMQVKAQYCQAMLDERGPYCLYDDSLFRNERERASCLIAIESEVRRYARNNPLARRALATDDGRIPVWTAAEAMTFGSFRRLYNNTKASVASTRVASSFNVSKRCLRSWLRTLVLVRNCCAHFNPYVVRNQIPAVPRPALGVGGDNASPLYVLVLLDCLLRGRADVGTESSYNDWRDFRQEAEQLLGSFAFRHPSLAVALRMPPEFVEVYAERRLPVVRFCIGKRRVVTQVLEAAA